MTINHMYNEEQDIMNQIIKSLIMTAAQNSA